jgi:hypothetical protein
VRKLPMLAILFAALASPAHGLAEESGSTVASELARIHAVLEKISSLLAHQSDSADVELLMKRVELAQGRATELERQVRGAGMRLEAFQSEKRNIELQIEMGQAGQESAEGGELSPEIVETMARNQEEQLKSVNRRIAAAAAELAEAQSRLDESNTGLRRWEELLDRRMANR